MRADVLFTLRREAHPAHQAAHDPHTRLLAHHLAAIALAEAASVVDAPVVSAEVEAVVADLAAAVAVAVADADNYLLVMIKK